MFESVSIKILETSLTSISIPGIPGIEWLDGLKSQAHFSYNHLYKNILIF